MQQTRRTILTTLTGALALPLIGGWRAADVPALPPATLDTTREALAPGGLVEGLVDELARQGRFSGVVMGAVDGRPVLARAWGMADRAAGRANRLDTRFNIASAGKMFTTVAVGQLLDEGKLSLDDRLVDHLPDFRPDFGRTVTIGQLLTHHSGLGSYFASPLWPARRASIRTVADYLELVRDEQPRFAPGERYEYSNSGFVLLGAVIERLTGQDYYDAIQSRVFARAGMTGSGYPSWDDPANDLAAPYTNGCFARPPGECTPGDWTDARPSAGVRGGPAGGAFSTAPDLNAFVEALKGGKLLSPATLERFKAEQGRMTRQGGPIDAYGFGFGRLTIHGRPSWGHNGGTIGAQAQVDVMEDAPVTLIVLANQDGAQRPASSALRRAVAPPGWTPPPPQAVGGGPVMVRPGG